MRQLIRPLLAILLFLPTGLAAQPSAAQRRDLGVVVAWFQNLTGDRALDYVGSQAAGWIADALENAQVGRVVPSAEVKRLMTAGSPPAGAELARRAGAGLLVTGGYLKRGSQLEFRADLVNVASGKVLTSSPPVQGPADSFAPFDALFQDLAVAIDLHRTWGPMALFWPRPKLFVAWKAYAEANADFFGKSDWAGSLDGFHRALKLDPDFVMAKYGVWVANGNLGRRAVMDSMEAELRAAMTASPGPLHNVFDWLSGSHRGDFEAMYQAGKRQATRDPVGEAYTLALPAVRTGRFEEVVAAYRYRDTTDVWVRDWRPWDGITLYALHTLGRHEEELGLARNQIARRGYDWGTGTQELTALAALGRVADLEAALARLGTLPTTAANTIGGALSAAGGELQAHGNDPKARELFQRRLAYYQGLPAAGQQQYGVAMANAFLQAGQYKEAMRRYDSLSRAAPDNQAYVGWLGISAVMAGDRKVAGDADARLAAETRPRFRSGALYWRSFIASVRGDCAQAVQFRREGLASGLTTNDYLFHRMNAYGKGKGCKELPALTSQRPGP